jgi:hypothetical protein
LTRPEPLTSASYLTVLFPNIHSNIIIRAPSCSSWATTKGIFHQNSFCSSCVAYHVLCHYRLHYKSSGSSSNMPIINCLFALCCHCLGPDSIAGVSMWGFYGGQSGSGTGLSSSICVVQCQHRSTDAPYLFTDLSLTLYKLSS